MPQGIHDNCPFCIQNGKVKVIAERGPAYLIQVLDPKTQQPMENCYFIIPKKHVEHWVEALMIGRFGQAFYMLLAELGSLEGFDALSDPNTLSSNFLEAGGQRIPHAHFWVIGRSNNTSLPSYGLGTKGLIDKLDQVPGERRYIPAVSVRWVQQWWKDHPEVLATLKPRHRERIEFRYGLDGGSIRTIEVTARQFGISTSAMQVSISSINGAAGCMF